MSRKFEIYAVRFADETYKKQIDKVLITTDLKYDEAVDTLERLMKDAGFDNLEQRLRHLRKKGEGKVLSWHRSLMKNLHGYLGPGGYELRRVEPD